MRTALAENRYFPERKIREMSFKDVAKKFLAECRTFERSKHKVRIYIAGCLKEFGVMKMNEIRSQDVASFRDELGKRMSPVSVNHYHRVLRRLFNWAKEEHLFLGENPASGKRVPLANERPFWRSEFLSEEELQKILEVADEKIKPIILCAALTGMRLNEIKRMKGQDVDLDRCVIRIPESKNGESGWVPIPDTLYSAIAPVIKNSSAAENQVFNFTNFERMWKRARLNAGIKMRFHTLRHTYGSHLMMKTGNQGAVQSLLRHKSPAMTARYAHLAPSFLRQAALTLDKMFPSKGPALNNGAAEAATISTEELSDSGGHLILDTKENKNE